MLLVVEQASGGIEDKDRNARHLDLSFLMADYHSCFRQVSCYYLSTCRCGLCTGAEQSQEQQ
jgi:hypothetical protein